MNMSEIRKQWIVIMEGTKGHNSVLLFKLQFKHLYIRIYYFCNFYNSYFIFIILLTTLILDSNFTIPIFQFLLQNFTILTLPILYFHFSFIILTFTILILFL